MNYDSKLSTLWKTIEVGTSKAWSLQILELQEVKSQHSSSPTILSMTLLQAFNCQPSSACLLYVLWNKFPPCNEGRPHQGCTTSMSAMPCPIKSTYSGGNSIGNLLLTRKYCIESCNVDTSICMLSPSLLSVFEGKMLACSEDAWIRATRQGVVAMAENGQGLFSSSSHKPKAAPLEYSPLSPSISLVTKSTSIR